MSHFYIQQWNSFCLYRRLSQQHPIFVVKETLEMKILHISDTHGCHRRLHDLPQADIVVHSGDLTMNCSEQEALDFMNWFCDLPYPQKIFISGNHDECLYDATIDGLDCNVHYLCNSGIEIEGLKFYGVPMFMGDCITDRQKISPMIRTFSLPIRHLSASSTLMTISIMARKNSLVVFRLSNPSYIFSDISMPNME